MEKDEKIKRIAFRIAKESLQKELESYNNPRSPELLQKAKDALKSWEFNMICPDCNKNRRCLWFLDNLQDSCCHCQDIPPNKMCEYCLAVNHKRGRKKKHALYHT